MTVWKRRQQERVRLRDALAQAALAGFVAHFAGPKEKDGETAAQAHGRAAFIYADAALKARRGA